MALPPSTGRAAGGHRSGKRLNNVARAHRAGAGDIIGWTHHTYTDTASPPQTRPSTRGGSSKPSRAPPNPASLVIQGHAGGVAVGGSSHLPPPDVSPLTQLVDDYGHVPRQQQQQQHRRPPAHASSASPPRPRTGSVDPYDNSPAAGTGLRAAVAAREARRASAAVTGQPPAARRALSYPDVRTAPDSEAAPRRANSYSSGHAPPPQGVGSSPPLSSMPAVDYGLGFGSSPSGPGVMRPGTRGHGAMYSLRETYDAISPGQASHHHQHHPGHGMSPIVTSPSAGMPIDPEVARARQQRVDRYIESAFDGRDTFLKVLAGRMVEVKVCRQLWSKRGLDTALEHVSRVGDDAVLVDFLHGLSGIGFPRWPATKDLTWVALLTPLVVNLLHSNFEDYLIVALTSIGSVLASLHPLFQDATGGPIVPSLPDVPPNFEAVELCRECARYLKSLLDPLNALTHHDGRVGRLARSKLAGIDDLAKHYLPKRAAAPPPSD